MSLDQESIRPVFRKLDRELSKLAGKPVPDNVHRFRTASRRVEALVTVLVPETNRNEKKLLKLLGRLRKKAGRLRDLDVQTSALRSLKIPQEPGRKSQLLRTLAEERGKREKKLDKALDKKTISEVRKRLKRCLGGLEIPKNTDPLSLARQKVAALQLNPGPVNEETLHRFRIAGKQARYIAELAGPSTEGSRLVEQLKNLQDSIGDWHDWAQLTARAEGLFGDVRDSALVATLRNVTRAKFRQAVNTLTETRETITLKKPGSITPLGRRSAQQMSVPDSAVA